MQHVFRHVAARFPVIWINGIGHRVPKLNVRDFRRAAAKALALVRPQSPALVQSGETGVGCAPRLVLSPAVLPWHHLKVVHRLNTRSLVAAIRKALQTLGLSARPVLVTGSPPSAGVVGKLRELAAIYFCMDDFLHMPTTTPGMLAPLEARLLERVDAVVATAAILARSKIPRSGRTYHLPQGVNYEHFATPRSRPAEFRCLTRPIIGFAGSIYSRCDVALLHRLADAHPAGSVVLIGPVLDTHPPLRRPNIHLLGPRPYRELPAYVQNFDVGIIPYVVNDETRAVDPLKLLEYLAAGIPVVTTSLPEAEKYREAVAVASNHAGFLAAVDTALATGGDGARERQSLAQKHSWARRAEEFLQIAGELVSATRKETT